MPHFRETAVMPSWLFEADPRTESTEDPGTDLESAHVFFPVQAISIKTLPSGCAVMTKLREGGWGPGQWHTWCAHKMYGQPCLCLCLSSQHFQSFFHLSLPVFCYFHFYDAQKVLIFEFCKQCCLVLNYSLFKLFSKILTWEWMGVGLKATFRVRISETAVRW